MSQAVANIFKQLIDFGTLDATAQMSEAEVRRDFKELSFDEQTLLWLNLQAAGSDRDYNIFAQKPDTMIDVIREAQHGDFDGWSEEQKVVIRAFLADIALAAANWS